LDYYIKLDGPGYMLDLPRSNDRQVIWKIR
jgi:hypothetical protein